MLGRLLELLGLPMFGFAPTLVMLCLRRPMFVWTGGQSTVGSNTHHRGSAASLDLQVCAGRVGACGLLNSPGFVERLVLQHIL